MPAKRGWSQVLRRMGPGLAVLLLGVVLASLSDRFLTIGNLLNVLRQVSINAIIAAGMTLVIITGGIDLSVGSVLALASALCAGVAAHGYGTAAAIFAALAVGALCGAVNGLTLVYTGGRPITGLSDGLRLLGTGYVGPLPVPILIMAAVVLLVWLLLNYTVPGRFIYAAGSNEEAARFAGIPVRRVVGLTYLLGGIAAALAGVIITGRLDSAQPTAGTGFELDAIAAVVLGGTTLSGGQGSVGGTLIGALIIGILDNGLNLLNVSSFYQQVAKGLVILVAVLLDRRKD